MRQLDENILPIGTYVLEYCTDPKEGLKDFVVAMVSDLQNGIYTYKLVSAIARRKDDDGNITADAEFNFFPELKGETDTIEEDGILINAATYWVLSDEEVERIIIENI